MSIFTHTSATNSSSLLPIPQPDLASGISEQELRAAMLGVESVDNHQSVPCKNTATEGAKGTPARWSKLRALNQGGRGDVIPEEIVQTEEEAKRR